MVGYRLTYGEKLQPTFPIDKNLMKYLSLCGISSFSSPLLRSWKVCSQKFSTGTTHCRIDKYSVNKVIVKQVFGGFNNWLFICLDGSFNIEVYYNLGLSRQWTIAY